MTQLSDSEFEDFDLQICYKCKKEKMCKETVIHKINKQGKFVKRRYIKINVCLKCFKNFFICMSEEPYEHYCCAITFSSQTGGMCNSCKKMVCFEHKKQKLMRLRYGGAQNKHINWYCKECAIASIHNHFAKV